ncbi:MAG: CoA transferase [Pseudomonadota bacterium]
MKPLNGLKVIAFEQYGAGPFGTQYLADMGADVIKVERPGTQGDFVRPLGPYFTNDDPDDTARSLFFQSCNRNKRSLTLDITHTQGREILHHLVSKADATANNLRGDVPAKLGLDYAHLGQVNAAIVCAHCSAYGREGSRRHWPGFDFLMQAECGYFYLNGEPSSPPGRMGLSVVDYMGGMSMALGLVSGVLSARTSGQGRDIDVNLYQTALFNINYQASWALNAGYEPQRQPRSAHPSLVPCQLYTTKDGWIYLMCNRESFWPVLCHQIDRPDLADNQAYANFADRLARRDELTEILDDVLRTRTTQEWLTRFKGKVPAAPVLTPTQALDHDLVHEHNLVQTLHDSQGNPFKQLTPPIHTGDEEHPSDRPAPALGADTDDILQNLGYDEKKIRRLRRDKIV